MSLRTLMVAVCALYVGIGVPVEARADPSADALGAGRVEIGVGGSAGITGSTAVPAIEAMASVGVADSFDVGLKLSHIFQISSPAHYETPTPTVQVKWQLGRWPAAGMALAVAPEVTWLRYQQRFTGPCEIHPGYVTVDCVIEPRLRTLRFEVPVTLSFGESPTRSRGYVKLRVIGDVIQPERETGGPKYFYSDSKAVLLGATIGWHWQLGPIAIVHEMSLVPFRWRASGSELENGGHGFNIFEINLAIYCGVI